MTDQQFQLCRYFHDSEGAPIFLPPKTSPEFKQQLTRAFGQVFPLDPSERYWHVVRDQTLEITENTSQLMQCDRAHTIASLGYTGILLRNFTDSNLKYINSKFSNHKLQTPKPLCIDWLIVDPASGKLVLIYYSGKNLGSKKKEKEENLEKREKECSKLVEGLKKLEKTGLQLIKDLKCLYPEMQKDCPVSLEYAAVLPSVSDSSDSDLLETIKSKLPDLVVWTKEKIAEQQIRTNEDILSHEMESNIHKYEEIAAGLAFSYQNCMFEVLPLEFTFESSDAGTKQTKQISLKDAKNLVSVVENETYLSTSELTTFQSIGRLCGCAVYENDDTYIGEVLDTWQQVYDCAKIVNQFPLVLIHEHDQKMFGKLLKIDTTFLEPEMKFEFDWLCLSKTFAGVIEVTVGTKDEIISEKLEQVIHRHIPYLQVLLLSIANEVPNCESLVESLERRVFSVIRLTQMKMEHVRDWFRIGWNQEKVKKIMGMPESEKSQSSKSTIDSSVMFWVGRNSLCELLYDEKDKQWVLGPDMTLEQHFEKLDKTVCDTFSYMMALCCIPFVTETDPKKKTKKFLKRLNKGDLGLDERHVVNKKKFLESKKFLKTAKSYLDLTLSPEQLEVLNSEPSHLVLYGEAGTGKTTVLFALIKKKWEETKSGKLKDTKIYFAIDQSKYLFREFVSFFIKCNNFVDFVTIIDHEDVEWLCDLDNTILLFDEYYTESFGDLVSSDRRSFSHDQKLYQCKMVWMSCVLPFFAFRQKSLYVNGKFTVMCLTTLFRSAVHIAGAALKLKYRSLDASKLSFASPTAYRNFFSSQVFLRLERMESLEAANERMNELKNEKQVDPRDCLQFLYPDDVQSKKLHFTGIEYDSVIIYVKDIPKSEFQFMQEAVYLAMTRAVSKLFILCDTSVYDDLRTLIEMSEADSLQDQVMAARFDHSMIVTRMNNLDPSAVQELMCICMQTSNVELLGFICESHQVFDFSGSSEPPAWLSSLFNTEKSPKFLEVLAEYLNEGDLVSFLLNCEERKPEIPEDMKRRTFEWVLSCYRACAHKFCNVVLWTLNILRATQDSVTQLLPECFHWTCMSGDRTFVESVSIFYPSSIFNSKGGNLDYLPIHSACLSESPAVIGFVVEKDPEQACTTDNCGYSPLYYLCIRGKESCAKVLVETVAERVSQQKAQDMFKNVSKRGDSALHAAVCSGSLEFCQWILAAYSSLIPLEDEFLCTAFLEQRNSVNENAVLLSILYGHAQILDWLLKDLKCSFFDLNESLYDCACDSVNAAVFPILVRLADEIEGNPELCSRYPKSPIVKACKENSLYSGCALIWFKDTERKTTPLIGLANKVPAVNFKWLYLSRLFKLTDKDCDGATALHLACEGGNEAIVKWVVLQNHFLLELGDKDGWLPVHYLLSQKDCSEERFQLFKWLVERIGQSLLAEDKKKNNLAHFAASFSSKLCYEYLAQKLPTLLQKRNSEGLSPEEGSAHKASAHKGDWTL